MRTRMSGGVRGVRSNAAPISIIVQVSRYRGVVFNHDCSQCWQRFGVAADISWLWFTFGRPSMSKRCVTMDVEQSRQTNGTDK